MLTFKQAEALARMWVEVVSDGKVALILKATRSKPYGWVFFWQSRQFIETGDHRHSFVGNAPIIVDRIDGEIRVTGTAKTLDEYLAEYVRTLPPARLSMRLPPPDGTAEDGLRPPDTG